MRTINKIILHCSDSDLTDHDDIEVVRGWHYDNAWLDIGYHFFINKAGVLQYGRPIWMEGAHCARHNHDSIGVCLSGKEYFTNRQFLTMNMLLKKLYKHLKLSRDEVYLHNYFDENKTCPNFSRDKIK